MHNLGTVFNFEVVRTLKKKSFWITAISFPVIIGVVVAIIFFSNQATQDAADQAANEPFSLGVTDQSGLVSEPLLNEFKAEEIKDKQTGIEAVKQGKVEAYFYYPDDLTAQRVEVYAKDVGLFENSRYQATAKALLDMSVAQKVDPATTLILQDNINFSSTTYKGGEEFNGFAQLIAPGLFLILFYILITMFGSQMLTSTTEEKENRVIEMILTTIKARTLIVGKILSLIVLALIQVLVIVVPVVVAYVLYGDKLALPNMDLTDIPLDPARIAIGAAIFIFSFLLFTGLLVGIGAATPTAKEAGGFFGVVMIFIFAPLYAVSLFVSAPQSTIVTILTMFPLTAPIPLMLRNAIGNLSIPEALIGIAILAISATIVMAIAVRIFRYGVLEYSNRISLSMIFNNSRKKQNRLR